jgi:hypothetical protein
LGQGSSLLRGFRMSAWCAISLTWMLALAREKLRAKVMPEQQQQQQPQL